MSSRNNRFVSEVGFAVIFGTMALYAWYHQHDTVAGLFAIATALEVMAAIANRLGGRS